MNHQLYVVTAVFNPHQFDSRTRLYGDFASYVEKSGARLLTVEAAFGNAPFRVTSADNPWNVQLRTNSILWHKERMGTIGVSALRRLVPDAWNVGWFDCDVTFSRPDWVAATVHALRHHPVIQPFSQAIYLNSNEEEMWNCPSTIRYFLDRRGYHQDPPLPHGYLFHGHPGLAWAFTMEALDALGGLYDKCAAGSGDTVMANCLKGKWDALLPEKPTPGMTRAIERWAKRCDEHIRGNIGFVRGACLHHWHGKSESRGYEKRWSIQSFHQFDPDEDLVVDTQGLFRWAGNKPRLEDDIRLSLAGRNEDEL